jgi:hypothetical protein
VTAERAEKLLEAIEYLIRQKTQVSYEDGTVKNWRELALQTIQNYDKADNSKGEGK